MIEGKGLGNKRINRKAISLSNDEESDLIKLSTSCNMRPAEMIYKILIDNMYDPVYLNQLQNQYCTQKAYRVRLVNHKGKLRYTLTGREDL